MSKVDLDNIDLGSVGTSGCYVISAWAMESMIEELRALRKVAEAARATLSFTDIGCGCDLQVNWICGPCALDKYLKELDGEK